MDGEGGGGVCEEGSDEHEKAERMDKRGRGDDRHAVARRPAAAGWGSLEGLSLDALFSRGCDFCRRHRGCYKLL